MCYHNLNPYSIAGTAKNLIVPGVSCFFPKTPILIHATGCLKSHLPAHVWFSMACQRFRWPGVADWHFGQDSAKLAGTVESLDSDLIFLAMQFPLQVFLGHSQSSMS